MIDSLQVRFQCSRILIIHAFYNDHGKSSHAKFVYHDILS